MISYSDFKEIIMEEKKAESHYSGDWGGKKGHMHFNGHGYFKVGARVKTPDTYKGVHHGTVKDVFEANPATGHGETYHVIHHLPKGHEDAYDENGEPHHKKLAVYSARQLTKHNPPEE